MAKNRLLLFQEPPQIAIRKPQHARRLADRPLIADCGKRFEQGVLHLGFSIGQAGRICREKAVVQFDAHGESLANFRQHALNPPHLAG